MKTIRALCMTLPILAATACGSATPTPALKSAQQEYSTAAGGPAAAYAPDSLAVARDSLGRAQRANSTNDTHQHSFAILARTRAEVADARGRTALAVQDRDAARTQLAQAETQVALRAAAECQGQRQGATLQQGPNPLDVLADRKENVRGGTLYVISSGIEFQKNEATLTAGARNKLDKLADAMKSEPSTTTVVVEGFTDPSGGAAINNPLSQRRAEAVAGYLQSRGVSQTVKSRGLGSSQPVGDNGTHEGREANRRVQVLILPR
jgi:outer membrane protein OmpA-like peptidoglycan-associated protein